MRIHPYRSRDLITLIELQQVASKIDGNQESIAELEAWLNNPAMDAEANTFVITDDDDELNQWGQAGTLDGVDGEIVGYTTLRFAQDEHSYHFLCLGTVHPQFRRQGAGRLLLIGARNRARLVASEFEFEAEQEGIPVYFEAQLPTTDPASPRLAEKFEMQYVENAGQDGMHLYRADL